MNKAKRILRALLIRLVFIAYSLMCIWRVTYISDNKYYWLMMIGVGFLLVETGILMWLRDGKEFRGVLPSVLFFLSCVVPSLWIMSLDEAGRRSKFQEIAENQETKIKDFVMSLDIIGGSPSTPSTTHSTTTSTVGITTILSTSNSAAALQFVARNLTTKSNNIAKSNEKNLINKLKKPDKVEIDNNISCCDVKIDYWFEEDTLQQLFSQILMLILVTSRWLITRSELSVNQRSLILVIGVATAADTLNFFHYLNLELVYRNKYLLYSALLIISLSLVQFVFLHVEESVNAIANKGVNNNSQADENPNEDYTDASSKYPLFFKKYDYMKQQNQPIYGYVNKKNTQNESTNSFTNFCCCCIQQKDPLFFILLAGLFLHDGSYLTFRIFMLSKLGWNQIADFDSTFLFFLIKNIFIIITQIYKVYSVTNEKRSRKFLDDYRNMLIANQNQQGTNNPYRFAQLYADVGTPLGSKAPLFKSMSTLGSNQIYFENSSNLYKPALPPALFTAQQAQGQPSSNQSITESVLAAMAQDYTAHQQMQQNEDVSFYHSTNTPILATPSNPFTAKVGKALYGLPFISRSKSSFHHNALATRIPVTPASHNYRTPFHTNQSANTGNAAAGSKLLKSSKI